RAVRALCGYRWLRWQSERRSAHIGDTGTDAQAAPPSPEPEKCPAAMRQNRGGMMVFRPQMPESVSFEMKRPPWYRAAFSNPTLGYAAQIPAIWHRRSDAA